MPFPPPDFHAERRALLARRIRDGLVVLVSAPVFPRGHDDEYHPYHADPRLRYLAGFAEPHSALLLAVRDGVVAREILFCRPRDRAAEQWEGERMGPNRARSRLQIAEAKPVGDFPETLKTVAADFSDLWFLPGANPTLDAQILALAKTRRAANRASVRPLAALRDVSVPIDEMRTVKTPAEIAAVRESVAVAVSAFAAAMRAAKSARSEREVEGEIVREYRRRGAVHAFAPIVAAGANGCCLHYSANAARVRRGEMILIDSGCDLNGYCSDITRVFPAGGKFSPEQRDVIAVVLDAQRKALAAVRPGAKMNAPERAATRAIVKGLRELKLLRGTPESIIARKTHKRFYPHRVGHFLGLDTHDPGRMADPDGTPRRFAAGMIVTIEPGIYIPDAPDIPKHLRGVAVRIEDDVLVTRRGNDILTAESPKTPSEIESRMRD